MTVTERVELALIVAFPGVLAAIGTVITAMIARANSDKADKIHVLVNSQLTNLKNELAAAKAEIAHLRTLLARP